MQIELKIKMKMTVKSKRKRMIFQREVTVDLKGKKMKK